MKNTAAPITLTMATLIAGKLISRDTVVTNLSASDAKFILGAGRARVATSDDEALPVFCAATGSAQLAEAAGNDKPLEVLVGSNRLPSLVTIGGKEVQLGDVVAFAHAQSELSVNDWNALPEETREQLLAYAIEAMEGAAQPQEGAQGGEKATAQASTPAGAQKAASAPKKAAAKAAK